MTRTGHTLSDIGGALPWGALRSFVSYLPSDSALAKEMDSKKDREMRPWSDGTMIAPLLAELIDRVTILDWHLCCAHTPQGKSKPKQPKPFPRPWRKPEGTRIGRDAIPISQFDDWWNT